MAHSIERNLSYSFGASNKALLGETIGQNLKRICSLFPDRTVVVDRSRGCRLSYTQFYEQTGEIAKSLLSCEIVRGDRIGVWASNKLEWVLIQYAAHRIGAILVNLNPAYNTQELSYIIKETGMKMIVSDPSYRNNECSIMIAKAKRGNQTLKIIQYFDDTWAQFVQKGALVEDQLLEKAEQMVQFDDPVNLQFTSGTTGTPKGVTLSHFNILNNGYFIGERLHYTEEDIVCVPVPFFHCFGMVIGNLACTSHGACIVIPSEHFDPKKTLEAVQEEKCTSLYGVPTMFIAELAVENFDSYDFSSIRTGVMAGSPCPVEIMKKVQDVMNMTEVSVCYGMTETSPVSLQTLIGTEIEKQVSTVGQVQDHLEVKIIYPETGELVERGKQGEICTRGYSVMLGYWNKDEETRKIIDAGRWLHTGDLGVMDEQGFVSITGRSKDIIIRGGENISPREIEEFLYLHDLVEDVQVIGVPDKKYGEEIMVWVKLIPGAEISEDELKQFCKNYIAHYKVPKYWKFVQEFPMTVSGKVRKVEMKEISILELGL